jgi:hypothetical protein
VTPESTHNLGNLFGRLRDAVWLRQHGKEVVRHHDTLCAHAIRDNGCDRTGPLLLEHFALFLTFHVSAQQ